MRANTSSIATGGSIGSGAFSFLSRSTPQWLFDCDAEREHSHRCAEPQTGATRATHLLPLLVLLLPVRIDLLRLRLQRQLSRLAILLDEAAKLMARGV